MSVLLFDLDGTLIDSTGDLQGAVNAVRASRDLPPLSEREVAPHIGWGLGHLLRGTLPELSAQELAAARPRFMAHYQAHLLDGTRPYRGARAFLENSPRPLGLVTNKPRRFVEPILEGLGWKERFGAVVAGDDPCGRKPDPGPLRHAARALATPVERCLFVGDSEVDAQAAAAASMPFVAVAWGRVARSMGDRVIRHYRELASY